MGFVSALAVLESGAAWAQDEPSLQGQAPIEVIVQGQSQAKRLLTSAESVKVVETRQLKRESADMGEVLARTQGIGVRRAGGLGSRARISLNGLTGDQVRYFLDGIPLEFSGYTLGISNVPLSLIERVEIHSGVVPIRFGADALGGAINLATSRDVRGTHAGASYEVGSFATHRITLGARHLFDSSGLFVRINGFADGALNNYPINVDATNERGNLYPVTVKRFHDAYQAAGVNAEVGLVNQSWARRLVLRTFASGHRREFQHNFSMTVPFGGASYRQRTLGANLRYEHSLGDDISVDAVAGLTRSRAHFLDVDPCVYDWFGECILVGRIDGETDFLPHDSLTWDNSVFARLNLEWFPLYDHAFRASVAPTFVERTGEERRLRTPEERDPLSAKRELFTLISGMEYEVDLFEDRLENILFGKQYTQILSSEISNRNNNVLLDQGRYRRKDRSSVRFGWGDSLRYHFSDWFLAKAAYELTTRLPRPAEVFGDNVFVIDNLELEPETSHNFNLGVAVTWPQSATSSVGALRATANGFLRDTNQLIALLSASQRFQGYQNVYAARSQGIEASAGWTSPRNYVAIDANLTHQSFRNSSSEGAFGDFEGDRIPNRPYFFANGSVRFQVQDLALAQDELFFTWYSRYVHNYFRSWESVGLRESKQVIPSQLTHSAALVYLVEGQQLSSSSSFEVQNLSNERVFDFYGVQRPGRAFYIKTTLEY